MRQRSSSETLLHTAQNRIVEVFISEKAHLLLLFFGEPLSQFLLKSEHFRVLGFDFAADLLCLFFLLVQIGINFFAVAALALMATTATPAAAQAAATPKVAVTGGVDFTNQYNFRGIRQNTAGMASQPWLTLCE